jgi:putative pyruvate formate lyase activating enzyme
MLESCSLCPRRCGVNRLAGATGVCSSADTFKVASYGPHFGEENPLVGSGGSGTIFFSHCNLLCVYCQNWEINHRGDGSFVTHARLARMMLTLQNGGRHNINFVTPTHVAPHIVRALRIAIADGLRIPLVYNTSAYDSIEVIRLLDGIMDIYLPDFKYQDAESAARFSRGAPDYPGHAAAAIREMHRQVGLLQQSGGVAHRGLLIRHLVLPENLSNTDGFVKWVAAELSPETHVNIMGQYRPAHQARNYPPLDRRPTQGEITQSTRWAREAGLRNFH